MPPDRGGQASTPTAARYHDRHEPREPLGALANGVSARAGAKSGGGGRTRSVRRPFLTEYFNNPAQDEANHVVYRNADGLVLLNRYPYTCGHLLVALGDPRPALLDYEPPQRAAFWSLVLRLWPR